MTFNLGDIMEASVVHTYADVGDVTNVFQFQKTDIPAQTDQQAIDDILQILESIYTIIAASITVLQVLKEVRLRKVNTNEVFGGFPMPTYAGGTSVNDSLAPGVAALTYFSTGQSRVVLKKYWGVFNEQVSTSAGKPGTGIQADLASIVTLLLTPQAGANGIWQYGHYKPLITTFVEPTGGVVSELWAYQRRRKRGVGS